ncbi:MAG: hypothetical protein ACI9D4_001803, partial [Polaribacter sp.]
PLIGETEGLEGLLHSYHEKAERQNLSMMRSKLGLFSEEKSDAILIVNLEETLQLTETDMTIFFRNLSDFSSEKPSEGLRIVKDAFYVLTEVSDSIKQQWNSWFMQYAERLQKEDATSEERKENMNHVNPKYVFRNYMAQLAIDDADKGDYKLIDELFQLLRKPYNEQPENEKWFVKRPDWARHKAGCSMLSCSS